MQLTQVKVSNFVKIEVRKVSSFLPAYNLPVSLRSKVKKQRFIHLSWGAQSLILQDLGVVHNIHNM